MGQQSASSTSSTGIQSKDPIQRKKEFLRRRRHQADQDNASKVIQVRENLRANSNTLKYLLVGYVKNRNRMDSLSDEDEADNRRGLQTQMNWKVIIFMSFIFVNWLICLLFCKEKMERLKLKLDYSEIFDETVGACDGLWVWEIENFNPVTYTFI